MGYVASNTYMSPAAYLAVDPADPPCWVDGPAPGEIELDELDRRLRIRIARTVLNGYLDTPATMNKRAVCLRFGVTERQATKLFARWRRDGFARIGARIGCAFDVDALRALVARDDAS